MKKSQNAVPAMLFLFLGLFIFYVVMMTPQEAEGFFNQSPGNETADEQKISMNVGLVGSATGNEILGTRQFSDVFVAYPSESTLRFHEDSVSLVSNIISSDFVHYDLIAGDNTAGIRIEMNVLELINGPVLKILLNGNEVQDIQSTGQKTINIPREDMNTSNRVAIVCQYQGIAFWNIETCNLQDLDIHIENYEPKDKSFTRNFDITPGEAYAEFVLLNFSIGENVNGGDLIIEFNGEELYRGSPIEGIYSTEKQIGLEQNNILGVTTETGGIYEIKRMALGFKPNLIAEKGPTLDFDLSSTNSDLKLNVYVNEIVWGPNMLNLRMEASGVTYQINPVRKGWNQVTIKSQHLSSKNTIQFQANGLIDVGAVEME